MASDILTRRNLPHWYVPGAVHFLTYRLAGTIPLDVLERLREERNRLLKEEPEEESEDPRRRERVHKLFFAAYDRYLDEQRDIRWLAEPRVAAMVRENLYHHNESLYHLIAYCIMPNHVHALFQPTAAVAASGSPVAASGSLAEPISTFDKRAACRYDQDELPDAESPLASIMRSLKGYTAHEANKLLKRSGQFWQHESYDHWVREDQELMRIVEYIRWNPAKAGLAAAPHDWFWGSAHDRFLKDGSELGLLGFPAPS